jgi:hypothetical protein
MNLAIFTLVFLSHFCRLKDSKITSFSNFEILVSLFGESSPEDRNPSRVQTSLSQDGFIFAFLEQASKEGTKSDSLLLSPVSVMFDTSLPNIYLFIYLC